MTLTFFEVGIAALSLSMWHLHAMFLWCVLLLGVIDAGEIKKYLKEQGLNVSDSEVQRLVDKCVCVCVCVCGWVWVFECHLQYGYLISLNLPTGIIKLT